MKRLFLLAIALGLWISIAAPSCLDDQQAKGEAPALGLDFKPPPRQPLLKKYFATPNGRNGLEDYFAALDRLSPARVSEVYTWESYKRTVEMGGELEKEARTSLERRFGDLSKTSVLDARRKAIEGLSDLREIVRKGNSKPIESVHPNLDVETVFPELAEFKNLVKFFVIEAYVAFADGRSASGTDALLVALKMANRLPQESFISRLVTVAMNAIVLAEFERHLEQLSTSDVRAVLACLLDQKEWDSGLLTAMQGETRSLEATIKMMREQPAKGDFTALAPEGSEKLFASMKPGDWIVFVSSFEETAKARMQAAQEILRAPETSWFKELRQQGWPEREEDPPVPKTLVDAGEQTGLIFTNLVPNMATSEGKYRTQLRLLRLHMRVLDHKWRLGRIPERLELAVSPEELQDHFGGGEFQYVPDAFGHYQLYSKGFKNIGRIDLRYRRDPNARGQFDPSDPPPTRVTSSS